MSSTWWKTYKGGFIVCTHIDINHFLETNEINWENSVGLCTDGAQSVYG